MAPEQWSAQLGVLTADHPDGFARSQATFLLVP